jgi:copper chaperone CopZ
MKSIFTSFAAVFALMLSVQAADVSVKITGVHLCCQSCVKGVKSAVGKVQGVTATADEDSSTVSLSGPDQASVQKAADALLAGGYFGKSSDASIKLNAHAGASGKKVQSLKVEGVHLCCGKCVKSVNEALGSVAGVKGNTAAKNAESFTVTGDFNDKEVFDALQKAGLAGRVGK